MSRWEKLTYAGHSAVFLSTKELVVAIDPWLSGNPKCPDDLKSPKKLDLIVLTHGHSDHASEAPALAQRTGAAVAATWELASLMIAEGVAESQVIAMNKGGSCAFKGLSISLTHAMHSSSFDRADGPVYAGEPCGVVLGDGESNVYHAGDTALFSDMTLIRDRYHPTTALLPIGDRFTMGPAEAARAAKIIGASTVIPIHYGTFGLLTGTADEFRREVDRIGGIAVRELKPGESCPIE